MKALTLAVLAALCLTLTPVAAQNSPTPPAMVKEKIVLANLKADSAMTLLTCPTPTRPKGSGKILAAIVPSGVQALITFPADNSILIQGEPDAVNALLKGVELVDRPTEQLTPEQVRVTLTPRWISASLLRIAIAALSPSESVVVRDRELVLSGTPVWMHKALRLAVQLETEAYKISRDGK